MKKLFQYLLIAVVFGFSTWLSMKATDTSPRIAYIPVFKETVAKPQTQGFDISIRTESQDIQVKEVDKGVKVTLETPVQEPKVIVKTVKVKDTIVVNEYPILPVKEIKARPFEVVTPSINL